MNKCWTQYIKVEKKHWSYCSFCGIKYESHLSNFKRNHNDKLGAYCPECWAYEFPDPTNPNKNEKLMEIIYDNRGMRIKLDLSYDWNDFDVAEFE